MNKHYHATPHSLLPDLVARAGLPFQTELADKTKITARQHSEQSCGRHLLLFPNADASPEKRNPVTEISLLNQVQLTFKARGDETQTPQTPDSDMDLSSLQTRMSGTPHSPAGAGPGDIRMDIQAVNKLLRRRRSSVHFQLALVETAAWPGCGHAGETR